MEHARTIWILAFGASIAHGQTPCGAPVGPDLIVADVLVPNNTPSTGTIDAASFGIAVCNLGTAPVQHSASTAQHPAYVTGLYRLEVVNNASRIEQIGMSWASHNVNALEQALCCTCTPVGAGHLGPGCSSTSSAATLGAITNLGTRYGLDAFNGTFTWPLVPPAVSGPITRKLQFALADVSQAAHPSASYFVEHAAIDAEDAAAMNALNNASYRAVTVGGTPADAILAVTGLTFREQAAIWAWKAADPNVQIHPAQVVNEGVFLVGSCATNLGNGLWHYEYAVLNLNSDTSCSAFHVPVPVPVHAFELGFHDVDYHDNDGPTGAPIDGTNWTPTFAAGSVSWATQTFMQNNSSNGLRFGTLYNFRFDAYAPPQTGNVTLDLWKSAGSTTGVAIVPASPPTPGIPYCFGDGSGAACPCGNASPVGDKSGCLHSLGTGGKLASFGYASIAGDTLLLGGTQMPSAPALYFQGTTQTASGLGASFGDGLRCAAGTVVRLGTKTNVSGVSQYPDAGDLSVSVRGGTAPGDVRTYQAWYRNAASFCTPSTFNLTNGVLVAWSF